VRLREEREEELVCWDINWGLGVEERKRESERGGESVFLELRLRIRKNRVFSLLMFFCFFAGSSVY